MYWHLHFEHCKDLAWAWKIGSCFIFSEWQNKQTNKKEQKTNPQKEKNAFENLF